MPTPFGDEHAIDYVAHGLGHQFGADHTWGRRVCGGHPVRTTAVEPGSGVTVMGDAGLCRRARDLPGGVAADGGRTGHPGAAACAA